MKSSWSQKPLSQGILYVFSIIGILATIAGVVYQITSGPRNSVIASYSRVPFLIPHKLRERGPLDTAIARADTVSRRIYDAYRSNLSFPERFKIPDSLRPQGLPSAYFRDNPVDVFARDYHELLVLKIENTGSKSLNPVSVLYKTKAYYEYKPNSKQIVQGESEGKFSIGELLPTESREIYLWADRSYSISENAVTIVYPEGQIQAEASVEARGIAASLVRHSLFFSVLWDTLIYILLFLGTYWIIFLLYNYRRRRQSGKELDRLLDPNRK